MKKILCFFLAAAGLFMLIRTTAFSPERWPLPLPNGSGELLPVMVQTGMNARQAADEFVAAGIVEKGRAASFARWMVRFSIDRRLRPGVYHVRKGSPWEVAMQMKTAEPGFLSLTLVPGTDIYSFGTLFPDKSLSGESLEKLLADESLYPSEMRNLLPETTEGRLAFLLPETYHLAFLNERELVSAAAALWWRRIGSSIPPEQRSDEVFEELAILASLVEREGFRDDERPRIAGVLSNRMEKGMQLQIDATVVYAWRRKGRDITRVLFKDLEIDSPYNTYKIQGLPPAPICTSSEISWKAVLNPEQHDFLYYVAQSDGYHLFAETFSEHQKNIVKVRSK
ncbi:MAG TPA: endolytic transglycosylase MltG [Aminobacteriaceae bacterium]|nr:endolytic transglycosylase MltG [Aminobacteriaceae bacterium]